MTSLIRPMENSIRNKLANALKTTHLEIINESHMHNVPKNSETHFKVVVVSDQFSDLSLLKVSNLLLPILAEASDNLWFTILETSLSKRFVKR